MLKKLILSTAILSALLLNGCGGGSSSSKSADIVIDNVSTLDIGQVLIKKSSDAQYGANILTTIIKSSTEVALSTKICDTNIDVKILATDNINVVDFKNQNLPCEKTLLLQVR